MTKKIKFGEPASTFKLRSGNNSSLPFKEMGSSPVLHTAGSAGHTHATGGSGSYRKDEEGNLQQTGIGGDIDKDDWKDESGKAGEFFEGLAGQAGFALLEAGLQIGATALTTPRRKPGRKGPDVSGFSNIQFGRRS